MCLSPYVIWTLYRIKVTAVFDQNLHKDSQDIQTLLESFAKWPFKMIHTEMKAVLQCLISHHTELGVNRSRTMDIQTDGYQEISVSFFVFLRGGPTDVASGSSQMALQYYSSICLYGLIRYFLYS